MLLPRGCQRHGRVRQHEESKQAKDRRQENRPSSPSAEQPLQATAMPLTAWQSPIKDALREDWRDGFRVGGRMPSKAGGGRGWRARHAAREIYGQGACSFPGHAAGRGCMPHAAV